MSEHSEEMSRSIAKDHPRLLFGTLMLGQMSQSLVFTAFVAALPQMAQDLGSRGPFLAQMTMALASLGLMTGCIVSGWILEKGGTRVTLLCSIAIFAVSGAGGLVPREPALLLGSRFILGFASACMATTCLWGIAAEYSGDRRAKTLGISAAIANCTALGTTVIGGYLAHRGWPLTFLQYPVFGALGFALAFPSLRQARPERQLAGVQNRPYLLRLLPFYLLVALMFAVMFMSSIQFAFMLEEVGVRDPADRSLVMGSITVFAALTSFGYGALQRRLGVLGAFALGSGCMAFALATVGWGQQPAYSVLGAIFMGIYVGILGPFIYHVVTGNTDSFSRSRAIGLLGAFGYLGGFLNPVVFSPMSEAIGLRNVYFVMACVMAALCLGAAVRAARRRASLRIRAAAPY